MPKEQPEGAPRARLLFYEVTHPSIRWGEAFKAIAPDIDFRSYPDWPKVAGDIPTFALVWNPEPGLLAQYPQIQAVFSLGAGVDHLTQDPDLPSIPVVRMNDDGLKADMADFILMGTLMLHRRIPQFVAQQSAKVFKRAFTPPPSDTVVTILGFGALGQAASAPLIRQGYQVRGWSRQTTPENTAVTCFTGRAGLEPAIRDADILVSLMPETPETANLIDSAFLALCKPGVSLLNAGRGGVIDDDALLAALDDGRVQAALLDVFKQEPLPADHPYWTHPNVMVTPHVAAITRPESAARYVVDGIKSFLAGDQPQALLDRKSGY